MMPTIHHFLLPPVVLADPHNVVVNIYTKTDGGEDGRGNPLPPKIMYYVENALGDLQPQSGSQRAMQSATVYDATHKLFLMPSESWPANLGTPGDTGLPGDMAWPGDVSAAVLIEAFFGTLAGEIPKGATAEIREQTGTPRGLFTVVFVASWGSHLEVDLKAVAPGA